MFHDLFYDMSSILACQKYTYTYIFFFLSPSLLAYLTVTLWSWCKERIIWSQFLNALLLSHHFFLCRYYLLFSKNLFKCTILSEPFVSLPETSWSLPLKNCLLLTWIPYYSNINFLLLNPYGSFIFLLPRKVSATQNMTMLIEYIAADETSCQFEFFKC